MGLLVEVAPQWCSDQPELSQRSADHKESDSWPGDWSFVHASRLGGPLHMEPLEGFDFPDRIRGIEAVCVQGSGELGSGSMDVLHMGWSSCARVYLCVIVVCVCDCGAWVCV